EKRCLICVIIATIGYWSNTWNLSYDKLLEKTSSDNLMSALSMNIASSELKSLSISIFSYSRSVFEKKPSIPLEETFLSPLCLISLIDRILKRNKQIVILKENNAVV